MTMQQDDYEINRHYGREDLGTTILTALQAAGKNPQQLTPDDLAPIDQFHTAGKQATLELMHLAAKGEPYIDDLGSKLSKNPCTT
jgi:hypothetical protein